MNWIGACANASHKPFRLYSKHFNEWQRIPQERIHGLIGSMSRRVRTLLQVNGGHNRYWIWRCVNGRLKPCVPLFFQCNIQKHVDNHCANFHFDIFHFSVLNCILKCMKYMLNFPMLRFFFCRVYLLGVFIIATSTEFQWSCFKHIPNWWHYKESTLEK